MIEDSIMDTQIKPVQQDDPVTTASMRRSSKNKLKEILIKHPDQPSQIEGLAEAIDDLAEKYKQK